MVIVHVAPITWNRMAGLSVSVPSLVHAQNSLKSVEASLLVTSGDSTPPLNRGFAIFNYGQHCNCWGHINLPPPFDKPDLVVFHSTYIPVHIVIALNLCRRHVPYIITPRGGMTREAQSIKGIKKKIANLVFFKSMVNKAAAIHCLTNGEARETKYWNQPIFVVGNGSEIPERSFIAEPGGKDGLKFVFIGRITPYIKGLDLLSEACLIIKEELIFSKVQILFYGPDGGGGYEVMSNYIRRLGLEKVLKLCGPVDGDQKKAVLKDADLFIHTSRSEGHPMAVLEALSYGVPCLLTPGTNMAFEVEAAGAGWKVGQDPKMIAEGLQEALASRSVLAKKGSAARRFAEANFCWSKVAAHTVEEYKNILTLQKGGL